jgi:hypothetical protein
MASSKKRRKETKSKNKRQHPPTGTFRHADGDRRRRGGQTYEQGLADKQAMQHFGAPPPVSEEEEE